MPRITITLPLSLGVLAAWLFITVGPGLLFAAGGTHTLADTASSGIGPAWIMAALFAGGVALMSRDRRGIGIGAPSPWRSVRLVWLPLLYAVLILLVALLEGMPPPAMLLAVAVNTAFVAVSEELMFRAVLLQGFMHRMSLWPAVLASSALFGAVHAVNAFTTGEVEAALWQSGAALLQGVGYAAIRLRTGSVWPMVMVHGLWDFSLMASILSTSPDAEDSPLPLFSLAAVLPMFLYGLYLLRGERGRAAYAAAAPP